MNLIPRDLKIFLENYKTLHTKILSSTLNISDLTFHGKTNNTFEIDFSSISISDKHVFLISIRELWITSSNPDTDTFSISLSTKDNNNHIQEYGSFYTGQIENKKYRSNYFIGTSVILDRPVKILLKINSSHSITSIFNIGITVNHQ